jgi:hypothetical protein
MAKKGCNAVMPQLGDIAVEGGGRGFGALLAKVTSGWASLDYDVELKPLGLTGLRRGPCTREGWEARLGRLGGIQPMANTKLEKAFLIFKKNLNSEPI